MSGTILTFDVHGTPAQMGSKKAFVVGKRAIITDDNRDKRRLWANAVTAAAADAMAGRSMLTGPVKLSVTFRFRRPASHFGTGRNAGTLKPSAPVFHSQTPDLDKLIRCLLDALSGVVFRDDRQVAVMGDVRRVWTMNGEGASVEVEDLDGEPTEATA